MMDYTLNIYLCNYPKKPLLCAKAFLLINFPNYLKSMG